MSQNSSPRFDIPMIVDATIFCTGSGAKPRLRKDASGTEKIDHYFGKVTYSSGCLAIMKNFDGDDELKKNFTINVVEPEPSGYTLGQMYQSAPGTPIVVQPYLSGSSIAYSITVLKLVPLASQAINSAPVSDGKN